MTAVPSSPALSPITAPFTSSAPVLVTQHSEQVWVAKLLAWGDFSAQGNSREDALRQLDQQVKMQLAEGEITYLDLPLAQRENPWLAIAGRYADDPTWDDYLSAIAANRQAANEAEGIDLDGNSMA